MEISANCLVDAQKPEQPLRLRQVTDIARVHARKAPVYRSEAVVATIIDRLACGEVLGRICADAGMPSSKTFFEWIRSIPEIRGRYEVALELRAHAYMDETIAIADDSRHDTYLDADGSARINHEVIARAKLRIDARLWYAMKIAPKKYGKYSQVTVDLKVRRTPEEIDDRIAELVKKAGCSS